MDFVSQGLSTFIPAALIAVITFIICSFLKVLFTDISILIIAILIQLTSVYALINLKATKMILLERYKSCFLNLLNEY